MLAPRRNQRALVGLGAPAFLAAMGSLVALTVLLAPGGATSGGHIGPREPSFGPSAGPYTVIFSETGLPSGTNWSVTLNNSTRYSVTSSIQFLEPAGRFPFAVGSVAGYVPTPSSGNVTVTSGTTTVYLAFAASGSGTGQGSTLLGLPTYETVTILAIAVLLVLLLLGGIFSCPDSCKPEGAKTNCGPHVYIDTVPCGEKPDWADDLQTGTEIIALGAEIAKRIEVVGEAYAKILESVPGWIPAMKKVTEGKVGFEAYARVVCSWNVCKSVWCVWPPWKWHLDWVPEGRFYGPYKLIPTAGFQGGAGGECFKPGMEPGQIYDGLQKAVDNNEKVQEAKRKCTEDCGK